MLQVEQAETIIKENEHLEKLAPLEELNEVMNTDIDNAKNKLEAINKKSKEVVIFLSYYYCKVHIKILIDLEATCCAMEKLEMEHNELLD